MGYFASVLHFKIDDTQQTPSKEHKNEKKRFQKRKKNGAKNEERIEEEEMKTSNDLLNSTLRTFHIRIESCNKAIFQFGIPIRFVNEPIRNIRNEICHHFFPLFDWVYSK